MLSRLASTTPPTTDVELDFAIAYNYTTILVEMLEEFRTRLLNSYIEDPTYYQVVKVLN